MSDYRALAEFRYQIRKFLRFSERAVRAAGVETRQYQLMLAIKGMPEGARPRIRELANRMQIQHHSAVELVNRLEAGGYARRERGRNDRREVLLGLTAKGERVLEELALHHHEELTEYGAGPGGGVAAVNTAYGTAPFRITPSGVVSFVVWFLPSVGFAGYVGTSTIMRQKIWLGKV